MAQKTPLPTKTVHYADRWNGTWFSDLSNFKHKYKEDFYLRFLITCYLRIKRLWLQLLSINNSGGFNFFQIVSLNFKNSVQTRIFMYPNKLAKNQFEIGQKILNKKSYFENKNEDEITLWQKRLSDQKKWQWSLLLKRRLIPSVGYGSFYKKHMTNQKVLRYRPVTSRVKTWFGLNMKAQILFILSKSLYFLKQKLTVLNNVTMTVKSQLEHKIASGSFIDFNFLLSFPPLFANKTKIIICYVFQ